MKNSIFKVIAPILLTAGITACSVTDLTPPPQPKLSGGFTCECTVTADIIPPGETSESLTEFVFSGSLKRLGTGFYELSLTSPETLSGMKISARDGDISSSLGELSMDISSEDMPDRSPVTAVFTSIDTLCSAFENGGELVSGEDGGWLYTSEELTAVFDGEGYMISLETANPSVRAEFSAYEQTECVSSSESVSETAPEETHITSSETTSAATTAPSETVTETSPVHTEMTEAASDTAVSSQETTVTTMPVTTME